MKRDLLSGQTLVVDRYAYSGVAYTAAKKVSMKFALFTLIGFLGLHVQGFIQDFYWFRRSGGPPSEK